MEKQKQKVDSKSASVNKAGFYYSFIQKKTRDLHQKSQANKNLRQYKPVGIKKQGQIQQLKNNEFLGYNKQVNKVEQQNKSIKDLELIKKGKILRVIAQNLVADQFRVQLLYQSEVYQLNATKYQIQQNNVRVLLDWYEKQLQLKSEDIRI